MDKSDKSGESTTGFVVSTLMAVNDVSGDNSAPASSDVTPGGRLARDLALYTLARLGLVVVLAAVIFGGGKLFSVEIPLLVVLIFALVIALPLSLVLFAKLRRRVNEAISAVDEKRRKDKAELRAKLRGDAGSTDGGSTEPSS